MKHADALKRVIEHMLKRATEAEEPPADALAHIAGCRQCMAELAEISSALTGKPSALLQDAVHGLTCQACRDALPAYVEDEVAGRDLAALHPDVARHLSTCAACHAQHEALRELYRQDEAGVFGEAPRSETWEAWFERHPWPAIWERMANGLLRLKVDISVHVAEGSARVARNVKDLFSPRELALAFRERGQGGGVTELLELPCPEINLMITVSVGPVSEGLCTLLLQTHAIDPPTPLANVRVDLFEGTGCPLESTATEHDGTARLSDLETGSYTIRVDYAGQKREFALLLAPGTP